MSATAVITWDEPAGATTPRGWLMINGVCTGFYLDYGPDSYRPGHKTDIGRGHIVSFCKPDRLCRDCEPGSILCVRYPNGPGTTPHDSRYVETIAAARRYVETGSVS